MSIFSFFSVSLSVAFVVFCWLRLNTFMDYAKLLKLDKFIELPSKDNLVTYPEFLKYKYGNIFIVKLLNCPFCLCFWGSVLFLNSWESIFYVFFVSYFSSLAFLILDLLYKFNQK